MYEDNNYLYSGLITGTMWDMIMKFISTKDDYSDIKSVSWGNYKNTILNLCNGRYIPISSSGSITSKATIATLLNGKARYGILTTGSTEETMKNNIYDLAGNLWEWTQEACWINDYNEFYILRGGSFMNNQSDNPVCFRGWGQAWSLSTVHCGFRPVLYIK